MGKRLCSKCGKLISENSNVLLCKECISKMVDFKKEKDNGRKR